jgi:hypothetical protein
MPGFIIFQSAGAYLIRGVEDSVPGVSYRVGPEGWMDRKVMAKYFGEKKPFGHWRKERNGFCTWITVEDRIRQQILRKASVRSRQQAISLSE